MSQPVTGVASRLVPVALVAAVALVSGCTWLVGVPPVGALRVQIPSPETARGIVPAIDIGVSSLEITLSGPADTVRQTIDAGTSSATFDALVTGEWTVTVNAMNASDPPVVVASGRTDASVLADTTTRVDVSVTPVDGQGTLAVRLDWPDGAVADPGVTATLTSHAGGASDVSGLFVITTETSQDGAEYTGSWDAGYYTLSLLLTDAGTEVWGDFLAVRIIAGESSVGEFSLVESGMDLRSASTRYDRRPRADDRGETHDR